MLDVIDVLAIEEFVCDACDALKPALVAAARRVFSGQARGVRQGMPPYSDCAASLRDNLTKLRFVIARIEHEL